MTGRFPSTLYTVAQIRAMEAQAAPLLAGGIWDLVEAASDALLEYLRVHWPRTQRVTVCCGTGNNGADGWLLAHKAQARGLRVVVLIPAPHTGRGTPEALRARRMALDAGIGEQVFEPGMQWPESDLVVDALLGTGLTRAPDARYTALIEAINAQSASVLAVDVPSGLDADRGTAAGACVRATATVTMLAGKRGLTTGQAWDFVGQWQVADLRLPAATRETPGATVTCLQPECVARCLQPRARNAHKGHFGQVLLVGGDYGMGGAIQLAATAAARVGAGWVRVATRPEHAFAMLTARPEAMALGASSGDDLTKPLARASVLAVGPGLGQEAWGRSLWETALQTQRPLVLDADGLNLLAQSPRVLPQPTVLTPHPGEAARLLGCSVAEIESDRFAAATTLAERYHAVVVLKGAGTLIAGPERTLAVCPVAYPGLASAGMGDVLTGAIAGLLAQGLDAQSAAWVGVYAHAQAAQAVGGDQPRGLYASEVAHALRAQVNPTAGVA